MAVKMLDGSTVDFSEAKVAPEVEFGFSDTASARATAAREWEKTRSEIIHKLVIPGAILAVGSAVAAGIVLYGMLRYSTPATASSAKQPQAQVQKVTGISPRK
jgi:hypothetical protein